MVVGTRMNSPLEPSEEVRPCQHLGFRLLVSRMVKQRFSIVLSYQGFDNFLQQGQETNISLPISPQPLQIKVNAWHSKHFQEIVPALWTGNNSNGLLAMPYQWLNILKNTMDKSINILANVMEVNTRTINNRTSLKSDQEMRPGRRETYLFILLSSVLFEILFSM